VRCLIILIYAYVKRILKYSFLRDLELNRTYNIAETIYESGILIFEVPLNRPNAVEYINKLRKFLPADSLLVQKLWLQQSK